MKQFQFNYNEVGMAELTAPVQALIKAAQEATSLAYAPYSRFHVGAAMRLSNGAIKQGANQENASSPAGICAERALLSSHNVQGAISVDAIAIAYRSASDSHKPLSPCGICRQTILEVQLAQKKPIEVYMCSPDNRVILVDDARNLLPFYFSNDFL